MPSPSSNLPAPSAIAGLSLDDLRLFCRVARLGTLSAVARERNVPVSQISRMLQRIEAGYGVVKCSNVDITPFTDVSL